MNSGLWYLKPHLLHSKYCFSAKTPPLLKGQRSPWKVAHLARVFDQLSSFKKVANMTKGPKVVIPTGSAVPSATKKLDMVTGCCLFFFRQT